MDKEDDIRILANIRPNLNWLDGFLHELGHAVYELNFDPKLPWLLRQPPSSITTEAIALLFNRQAYRYEALCPILDLDAKKTILMKRAENSLSRRQLILSRFVITLTYFERELYKNPNQDLNDIWWYFVEKFQKIAPPKDRANKNDWAAKLHIGLVPVYAFSYLLGEIVASQIEISMINSLGAEEFYSKSAGKWLCDRIFSPGNRMPWTELLDQATGEQVNSAAWIRQFCTLSAHPE